METSLKTISLQIAARIGGVVLACFLSAARAASPSIIITNLPAFGSQGNLSGLALNANPASNCVAVFIFVGNDPVVSGGFWYSRPSCASALTPIQPDGSWTANITTISSDANATEIAAFLVPANYNPPCVDGASGLPIPPQAEAVVYADRVNPSARQFNFSDYGWWVKTSGTGVAGPGPNYFSDSTNNVWVDAQGSLHLQITHTNSQWQCAEIISDRSFGYGQYRFTVSTPVNNLNPNVVLGLFTYSYDTAYTGREMDLEFSRWEYGYGPSNVADYAVQPYTNPGQVLHFPLPAGGTNSTHSFIWTSTNIAFQSLNGNFASPPAPANILESWNCPVGTPPAGGEQVHMNLYLDNGNPPFGGQPVEVVISQFEFVPLGAPQPAQMSQLTILPDGNVLLGVNGQTDRHYEILSSSNLLDWREIGAVLATNNLFQFTDTNPASSSPNFYNALTEP